MHTPLCHNSHCQQYELPFVISMFVSQGLLTHVLSLPFALSCVTLSFVHHVEQCLCHRETAEHMVTLSLCLLHSVCASCMEILMLQVVLPCLFCLF